jgi:DNA-binding NarL/FixJ family response regulator
MPSPLTWANLNPMRVVIIDDNEDFLRSAREFLEAEGLAIIGTATSAAAGIELVRRESPDVVLVDIELGGESGFDAARALHPQPVVMISSHAPDDVEDEFPFVSKSELSADAIQRASR